MLELYYTGVVTTVIYMIIRILYVSHVNTPKSIESRKKVLELLAHARATTPAEQIPAIAIFLTAGTFALFVLIPLCWPVSIPWLAYDKWRKSRDE